MIWSRMPLLARKGRMRSASPRACLVHMHLPRTGGTALRRLLLPRLLERISPSRVFLVDMGPEYDCLTGSVADLEAMPRNSRRRLRFVAGHLPPRVLDLLPRPVPFTFLREPVERAVSEYWYCYHDPANPAHDAARRLGPADFFAAGFSNAGNAQARYLSGSAFEDGALSEEELLRRALNVLENLHYIGVFESYPQAIADVAALAGLPPPDAGTRWNSAERNFCVSDHERERIAACNRVDAALHSWARQGRV